MKICGHCGAQCDDRDVFCNSCGTAFPYGNVQQQQQQYYGQYGSMPPYQQQGQYNPYQNTYQQYPDMGFLPKKRTAPLVLGIIGIVFAILLPLVTYCCSIPGLVMASKDINLGAQGRGYQILNIVALAIAAVNSILGIFLNNFLFY